MRWNRITLVGCLFAAVLSGTACDDDDSSGTLVLPSVAGTWTLLSATTDSELVNCDGVMVVPPGPYTGFLARADAAGVLLVDQSGETITLLPVVDAQPSGLVATTSATGTVNVAGGVTLRVETLLEDDPRPDQTNVETVNGGLDLLGELQLTATRWSTDGGGCDLQPVVAYRVRID